MSKIISPKKKFKHFTWTLNGQLHNSTVSQRMTTKEFANWSSKSYNVALASIKITSAS